MNIRGFMIGLAALLWTVALPVQAKSVVDVMVLYDDRAWDYFRGNPETTLNNWIIEGNRIYENSGVDIELRLVHHQRWEPGTGGNQRSALDRLTAGAPDIDRLQEEYGADYITLLSDGQYGGLAWIQQGRPDSFRSSPRYARNVVAPQAGVTTFLHELGHNMTLDHSRRQGNVGGVFQSGVGHGVDGLFGTIMTYPWFYNAPEIPRFSNSQLTCKGAPCGIPEGQPQSADAAFSLNYLAAAFEATMPSVSDNGVTEEEPPQAELAIRRQYPANNTSSLVINHLNGDTLNTAELEVRAGGEVADAGRQWQGIEQLAPGDQVTFHVPGQGTEYFRAGQSVEIVHTPSDSVIAETTLAGEPDSGDASGVVEVFQHWDYDGYSAALPVGRYTTADLNERNVRENDLSSVRVSSGYVVELYIGDNFTGPFFRIKGNIPRFPHGLLNDTTSSIVVRKE